MVVFYLFVVLFLNFIWEPASWMYSSSETDC